jgi:glycosyltransferase involved in cell wall biosynthesis
MSGRLAENRSTPDLVHLTNTLISGAAHQIKQALNVPLVCGLHGEDIFVDGLPEPYNEVAMQLIRQNAADIDHFIAISEYYSRFFGQRMSLDPARISLVRPGIALEDYRTRQEPPSAGQPLTIGYFARISPEKGLHLLAEAFIRLAHSGEFPGLRLKAGGYLSRAHAGYVAGIQKTIHRPA